MELGDSTDQGQWSECSKTARSLRSYSQRLGESIEQLERSRSRQTEALGQVRDALGQLLPAILHLADLQARREARSTAARVKVTLAVIAAASGWGTLLLTHWPC